MRLEELKVYQLAMEIAEDVWRIVKSWDYFSKDTIGKQFVRAVDGMAANISEGYGRFHYKESRQFYYYARGSLYETKTWLIKANNRNLIKNVEFQGILKKLDHENAMLNNYIGSVGP